MWAIASSLVRGFASSWDAESPTAIQTLSFPAFGLLRALQSTKTKRSKSGIWSIWRASAAGDRVEALARAHRRSPSSAGSVFTVIPVL